MGSPPAQLRQQRFKSAAGLCPAVHQHYCRLAPLPDNYDWQRYGAWAPDFCPLADEACY